MAITVVLALTGAMVLSLTFVPASIAIFMATASRRRRTDWSNGRGGAMSRCLRGRFAGKTGSLAGTDAGRRVPLATRLGSEFIPSLEGDLAMQAIRIPERAWSSR